MALGSMSLNLALPDGFSTDIGQAIEALVPAAAALDLTMETLNDAKTRLAPRSRDETLDAGRLQLAPGTAVVVDLRTLGEGKLEDTGALVHLSGADAKTRLAPRSRDETLDAGRLQLAPGTAVVVDLRTLGEGKLEDTGALVHLSGADRWKEADLRLPVRGPPGVRNLRHLATAITQQKLAYEFPYSSFELDTDLNFVLLSEGKAILPVGLEPIPPAGHQTT